MSSNPTETNTVELRMEISRTLGETSLKLVQECRIVLAEIDTAYGRPEALLCTHRLTKEKLEVSVQLFRCGILYTVASDKGNNSFCCWKTEVITTPIQLYTYWEMITKPNWPFEFQNLVWNFWMKTVDVLSEHVLLKLCLDTQVF